MSKRTRGPNVAKKLVENSISAMLAAIEIHNKPIFSYRYETSVILFINARELLLKGYIYKYDSKVQLWEEDEEGNIRPKSFSKCLSCVKTKLGKKYFHWFGGIKEIYEYRCNYIHYYGDNLDAAMFLMISESIKSFIAFINELFPKNSLDNNNFIILPIGFKKIIDPVDILLEISSSKNSSKEVKEFIKSIIKTTQDVYEAGNDNGIFTQYGIKFYNEKSSSNVEILAKRDSSNGVPINITKSYQITDNPEAPIIQISDEEALSLFPYIYRALRDELKVRYLDSDRTGGFDRIVQGQLKLSKIFSFERKHNPSSLKSSSTWYYSEKCLTEVFDKIYTKR